MTTLPLKLLFLNCFAVFAFPSVTFQGRLQSTLDTKEQYQCLPCGNDCDNKVYNEQGKCSHCQMQLVKKASVVFTNIQPSKLCNFIASNPDVVLLDVRTVEEFEGKAKPDFGSLKNAINIPIQELKNRLSELEAFKNKTLIVYCSHSHRSPQASYLLTQNGFTNVINMSGGMSAMEDASCKR